MRFIVTSSIEIQEEKGEAIKQNNSFEEYLYSLWKKKGQTSLRHKIWMNEKLKIVSTCNTEGNRVTRISTM